MANVLSKKIIVSVALSATLCLSVGAEASSLFAPGGNPASREAVERQIGLFEQAFQWLNGAWNGLTSMFAFTEQEPLPPDNTECTTDCGDAGPGIDPLG